MTILLKTSDSTDIHALSLAVYNALLSVAPDLAAPSAVLVNRARDAAEYLAAVLGLDAGLRVEWEEG